ncbi:MAG: SPOR domain-containing protein [Georgfuchsia sp.]
MTDTELQPDSLDEDTLRRRLINRIALAGVAIVVLLGGLAVIDSLYVAPASSSAKIVVTPIMTDALKPIDAVAVPPEATIPPEPPQPQAVPTIKMSAEPEESSSASAPLPKQLHPLAKPTPIRALAQDAQRERHFVLQMGVFNNVDNAQELLARLQKIGVPAQIEARVQVGPFRTKAEADVARTKLNAMGLNAGLLMAIHH